MSARDDNLLSEWPVTCRLWQFIEDYTLINYTGPTLHQMADYMGMTIYPVSEHVRRLAWLGAVDPQIHNVDTVALLQAAPSPHARERE